MNKRMMTSSLICAGLSLALNVNAAGVGNAGDFKIENHTKKRISFKINHVCSINFGIIKPGKSRVIPEAHFRAACGSDKDNCITDVYQSGNCTGRHIATLRLATSEGVKEVMYSAPAYAYSWRPYFLTITEAIS